MNIKVNKAGCKTHVTINNECKICYTWMQCSFKEFLEFLHILLLHVATGRFGLTISLYSLQNVAHIQKTHVLCVCVCLYKGTKYKGKAKRAQNKREDVKKNKNLVNDYVEIKNFFYLF